MENKLFIMTQPDSRDRNRRRLDDVETDDEDLGALNFFSWMYGNEGDY